ncbi:pyridoxamine 5'-phosphate oxidase family protein [Streptomyces sp. DSM 44917]|uniref:Pyridoxamine 5'-phosphate oxidase family protein n=1 Tax=Streptomyces boetiae TaxID=3075541 RepID=A0ABU2LBM2_9ACTN|nr:pyridoxamine 5'-phosphate oxidase family protein [Streptomyces sp. DSM 44917]MDT0308653.1 pyridoxamine 5'-phosphate oxidase family protein [Streptomyces sp. DSM 44917]
MAGRGPGRRSRSDHRSDLGRRVALRREQLGLSRETVADRAGVAPQYLRYLEERPASPSAASLTRVARALETTVAELTGSEVLPGAGARAPGGGTPELIELDTDQCYRLVAAHTLGRVAVAAPEGPAIVPVSYVVTDGTILFRAPADIARAAGAAAETAFEVDHLDEAQGLGWSVLVRGEAEVTGPPDAGEAARAPAVRGPSARARNAPGPPGVPAGNAHGHKTWVRLRPSRVTGKRLTLG